MADRLTPFTFGSLGQQLFGCHHPPAEGPGDTRDLGVVLCPAHGHEYIQFHRAFQALALQLSQAGFPALRFDFAGCGDSEGDHAVWGLDRWKLDIGLAIDALRQRARIERVALVGLRLGASLAGQVAETREDVTALVLWDPVLQGAAYRDELRAQHARMLGYAHVHPGADGSPHETLGFPFPEAFAAELESLDLSAPGPLPPTLLIESNPAADLGALARHLAGLGGATEHKRFSNPNLWVWTEDFGKVHVPRDVLGTIGTWLEETAP